MIPTDSNYYQEFQAFMKGKCSYDGAKENSPIYIGKDRTGKLLDLLVKHQVDFMTPHKNKLEKMLSLRKD